MNNQTEAGTAAAELIHLMGGFWHTAIVHALAGLGVADLFADAEKSCADVAAELDADATSLFRLMRAAAALDLARHHGADRFTLTPKGQCLRSDVPGSVRGMALHMGGELYRAFGDLAQSVKSGAPPAWIKHGPAGFAALDDDPQAAAIFNQAMVDGSKAVAEQAAAAYDFSGFHRVMDVGGGYGAVLAVLLNRHPRQQGIILDLAHSAEGAGAYLEQEGVADRARFETGSFFDGVPAAADCYLLKYIVHDWSDDYARRLLANCAAAARETNAVVVLIERIVPARIESNQASRQVVRGDLTMMLWAGKERTEAEFRTLFNEAGLQLTHIETLPDSFAVIEAIPL